MKRCLLVFGLILMANFLIKSHGGLQTAVGCMMLFCAGCIAGYQDGIKAGKRLLLTGKEK